MEARHRRLISVLCVLLITLTQIAIVVHHRAPAPLENRVEVTLEAVVMDIAAPMPEHHAHCAKEPPPAFDALVLAAAEEYRINGRALALTVYRESDCDAGAVGAAGEIGLAQIHPGVWETTLQKEGIIEAAEDLFDPATNLRASAYILRQMAARSRNAEGALRRYNGSGKAARAYAASQVESYRTLWNEEPWVVRP